MSTNPATSNFTIFHIAQQDNLYEITMKGLTISRIIKYCGEDQIRREIRYDSLTPDIKAKILDHINKQ